MQRVEALELIEKYIPSANLRKHVLAVEAGMRGYARKFGADEERWGVIGLLHDLDYELYPEEHPHKAVEILQDKGFSREELDAILGHGIMDFPRETLLAKTLFAVDELSSFIIACVLVRPEKFTGLSVKSVKKKLKDKGFARAVNRDLVQQGANELGVDFTEHLQTVIDALSQREEELNAQGESLID